MRGETTGQATGRFAEEADIAATDAKPVADAEPVVCSQSKPSADVLATLLHSLVPCMAWRAEWRMADEQALRALLMCHQDVISPLSQAFAFALPNHAALQAIARHAPHGCIEVGAGNGLWAALLRAHGVPCAVSDSTRSTHAFCKVAVSGSATAASRADADSALLLCWPPLEQEASTDGDDDGADGGGAADGADNLMALDALRAFPGNTLLYVGEWRGSVGVVAQLSWRTASCGHTAGARFQAHVEARFDLVERVRRIAPAVCGAAGYSPHASLSVHSLPFRLVQASPRVRLVCAGAPPALARLRRCALGISPERAARANGSAAAAVLGRRAAHRTARRPAYADGGSSSNSGRDDAAAGRRSPAAAARSPTHARSVRRHAPGRPRRGHLARCHCGPQPGPRAIASTAAAGRGSDCGSCGEGSASTIMVVPRRGRLSLPLSSRVPLFELCRAPRSNAAVNTHRMTASCR